MRKIYLTLVAVAFGLASSAQSYYNLPAIDAGFNPGNLNMDPEQPAASVSAQNWTSIMSSTASDAWSPNQTLPFAFDFNGSAETQYKVSNTGVLTFDVSATGVPAGTPMMLPATAVPDKSVCVWGLNLSGSNDGVVTKTFGTAPNRQHWVMYASASATGLTGTAWAYWAIVLEETTNKIYIVDQRTYSSAGGNVSLSVGVQVDGSTAVSVGSAVASRTTATGGNGSDPSDNTWYEMVYGVQAANDMAAINSPMAPIVQTNTAVDIESKFRNRGSAVVSSFDLNYSINNGSPTTVPMTNSLTVGEFGDVAHPAQWTPTVDGTYNIRIWADNINGASDGDNSNDTLKVTVQAVPFVPERNVVIEEKTGTWCGWCPRGTVGMEYMATTYGNHTLTIAVHNGDPMVVTGYDGNSFIGLVAPGGYPGSSVDRVLGPDPNDVDLENAYNERRSVIPFADVKIGNVTYDATSGSIDIDMSSEFILPLNGIDYRYAVVVMEDGVKGASSGYAQVNYYSSTSQNLPLVGAGKDWQAAANPVPASEMVYDHVARAIEPSFFGEANSVPSTITAGQTVNHTMSLNLPSSVINDNHVYLGVLLLDNNTYEVINAAKVKLTATVGVRELEDISAKIYPNPASDRLFIEIDDEDFSYTITNAVGQNVMSGSNTGKTEIDVTNFDSGVYFISIDTEKGSSTERVVIH